MERLRFDNRAGYVALISVIILGAIGSLVAVSLLLLGLGSAKTSFAIEQSNMAKALANACAEQGLLRIKKDSGYTGTTIINFGNNSCSYFIQNPGGQSRTIDAKGTVGSIDRKIKILISAITPSITISSWQEVADF
jgi:hypothetical protein